jgi:hypothetical protein
MKDARYGEKIHSLWRNAVAMRISFGNSARIHVIQPKHIETPH